MVALSLMHSCGGLYYVTCYGQRVQLAKMQGHMSQRPLGDERNA